MIYLLDTNVCVVYLNRRVPQLLYRLDHTPDQQMVVCSIVKAELF